MMRTTCIGLHLLLAASACSDAGHPTSSAAPPGVGSHDPSSVPPPPSSPAAPDAGTDAGDGASPVTPPRCDPARAWADGTFLAISTTDDDRFAAITPDELTLAWTTPDVGDASKVIVHYVDRSSTGDAFAAPRVFDQPAGYAAIDRVALSANGLQLTLAVTNEGDRPLPFGLGWHPYFPLTPQTTLEARSRFYWTEVDSWLPGERAAIPPDLDFARPRKLPRRWVNNGFEGWDGRARIAWPERSVMVDMTAGPLFRHAFLFVGDKDFDPDYADDYFCFEPMSHLADGHNMADLGGLAVLAPGERLSGGIDLRPRVKERKA